MCTKPADPIQPDHITLQVGYIALARNIQKHEKQWIFYCFHPRPRPRPTKNKRLKNIRITEKARYVIFMTMA